MAVIHTADFFKIENGPGSFSNRASEPTDGPRRFLKGEDEVVGRLLRAFDLIPPVGIGDISRRQ